MKVWLHMDQVKTPDHLYTDDPFCVELTLDRDYGVIDSKVLTESGEPAEWAREWLEWSSYYRAFEQARFDHITEMNAGR